MIHWLNLEFIPSLYIPYKIITNKIVIINFKHLRIAIPVKYGALYIPPTLSFVAFQMPYSHFAFYHVVTMKEVLSI